MEIPAANLVNKYIAAQGPLPHTCAQFWQVIWDQKLSLIVMLTTLTERGRVSGLISFLFICVHVTHALWNMNLRAGKSLKYCQSSPYRAQNLVYRPANRYLSDGKLSTPACSLVKLELKHQTAPPTPGLDPLEKARRSFLLPYLTFARTPVLAVASLTLDMCLF